MIKFIGLLTLTVLRLENHMTEDKKKFFIHKHKQLINFIKSIPELGKVIFQGKSLEYHSSNRGLDELLQAYNDNNFDPIALNHGIKRLRIGSYNSDLIWDHPDIKPKVEFNDEIIDLLESSFNKILNETSFILDKLVRFPDSDTLVNKSGEWSYYSFYDKNTNEIEQHHKQCPIISSILKKLDLNTKFGFAFISALTKKSVIKPHQGSTSFRKRYHLGIVIPEDNVLKIRIGKDWVEWKPGKAFSFYDSVQHEVINDSEKPRIILIFDVWSPSLPKSVRDFFNNDKDLINYGIC